MSKKMRRIRKASFGTLIIIVSLFALTGCGTSPHGIPNGDYATGTRFIDQAYIDSGKEDGITYYALTGEDDAYDYYISVKGNKVKWYFSNALTYKCNIVVEDGKIFFESYIFRDILFWTKSGSEFKCEVKYDDETKMLAVYPKIEQD